MPKPIRGEQVPLVVCLTHSIDFLMFEVSPTPEARVDQEWTPTMPFENMGKPEEGERDGKRTERLRPGKKLPNTTIFLSLTFVFLANN